MNKLFLKKTTGLMKEIAKVVVIEGLISVASQGLRDVSKSNYKKAKESGTQIINLTTNQINGREPSDWDLI